MKQQRRYLGAFIYEEDNSSKLNVLIEEDGTCHRIDINRFFTDEDKVNLDSIEGVEYVISTRRYGCHIQIGRAFVTDEVLKRVKEAF